MWKSFLAIALTLVVGALCGGLAVFAAGDALLSAAFNPAHLVHDTATFNGLGGADGAEADTSQTDLQDEEPELGAKSEASTKKGMCEGKKSPFKIFQGTKTCTTRSGWAKYWSKEKKRREEAQKKQEKEDDKIIDFSCKKNKASGELKIHLSMKTLLNRAGLATSIKTPLGKVSFPGFMMKWAVGGAHINHIKPSII